MNDEDILRKKLDRLNQNSHYGIMIDTEITDIVRSHIKRLEEKEMKATSTEEFKDIIAIDFELQTFPDPDTQDKFIVSATNRDDIFAFVFEGPNIVDACRKTGLFTGWEKDQRIKFLETEYCLRLRDEAQKEAYKLKKENEKLKETIKKLEHADMLDKAAADYWSKEYDTLLERFAKLQVENEKLKEKIKELEEATSKVEPYSMDDTANPLNPMVDDYCLELTKKIANLTFEKKMMKKENKKLKWENENLKKELALEKAANEAQHKFIREYAGKGTEVQFNYVIDDAKEVSYVIVEKNGELAEENKKLKQEIKDNNTKILQYIRINHKLQDENEELKYQLMDIQATKEVVEQKLNTREGILDQAKKCVCGQREQDYGTPESNFQLIADLWNGYLRSLDYPQWKQIQAKDVAMMMALMKIARIRNGGGSGDSFVDLAGYAACGGEIWALQKETN